MELLADKIIVRFTKESVESIYLGKEITRDDGSKVRLFIATPVRDEADDRKAVLTVQTAVVEHISPNVTDIQVGDLAIVNYDLFNMVEKKVEETPTGITFCISTITTYHNETFTAYANQKSKRDQIVYSKGDYNEISLLLGIIRNDKLISRDPFIFIDHASTEIDKKTHSGIIYTEKQKYYSRRILSSSKESKEKYSLSEGDKILMFDGDVFEIRLFDKSIDCVYDIDVIAKINGTKLQPIGGGR